MNKKHLYTIKINGGSKQQSFIYQYGQVKNISLYIGKQRATVLYQIGTKRDANDVVAFKDKLFGDAYRKVYLLHALIQNQGLKVKSIEVIIDDMSTYYDNSHPLFPFMFSMIQKEELGLCEKWNEITPEVVPLPKTKMESDRRFTAMFSYLASKSKQYEVERFTSLWTAMNAYYFDIASNYECLLRQELGIEGTLEIPNSLCLRKKDTASIGALCWILSGRYRKVPEKEADKIWNKYETEKILCNYDQLQIQALYKAAKRELSGVPLPKKYEALSACADKFGAPLYTYLLLLYPYHWRCDLFHGSRATLLFCAYNDYEIAVIRAVNYFLDMFLNEHIPETFQSDFGVKHYERVKQYMRECRDFDNAVEKYYRKKL